MKIRQAERLQQDPKFLQILRALLLLEGSCQVAYCIDPQGWLGYIPLNVSWAFTMGVCCFGSTALYFVTNGLFSTLGKVSPQLSERMETLNNWKIIACNTKVASDFLMILLVLTLPDYTWLFVAFGVLYSSVVYISVYVLTQYVGKKLVEEIRRLKSNTAKNGLQDTASKLNIFLYCYSSVEIILRPLVIVSGIWWAAGHYSPNNYYEAPSLGMALFINGIAIMNSTVSFSMMQLYARFDLGRKDISLPKETFVIAVLAKLAIRNNRGKSLGSTGTLGSSQGANPT